jgi:hypothetical protein
MNNIHRYGEINYIFQLCPQLKIFQVECHRTLGFPSMIKTKDWENLLIPTQFLKKIEISVDEIHDRDVIDLSKYDTKKFKSYQELFNIYCIK